MCAGLFVSAYREFKFWFVTLDLNVFVERFGMAMAEPLCIQTNVRELLHFLDIVEQTRFEMLPSSCQLRSSLPFDDRPGHTGDVADWVYYVHFLL